jgi:hypothetical protein
MVFGSSWLIDFRAKNKVETPSTRDSVSFSPHGQPTTKSQQVPAVCRIRRIEKQRVGRSFIGTLGDALQFDAPLNR